MTKSDQLEAGQKGVHTHKEFDLSQRIENVLDHLWRRTSPFKQARHQMCQSSTAQERSEAKGIRIGRVLTVSPSHAGISSDVDHHAQTYLTLFDLGTAARQRPLAGGSDSNHERQHGPRCKMERSSCATTHLEVFEYSRRYAISVKSLKCSALCRWLPALKKDDRMVQSGWGKGHWIAPKPFETLF